MMLHGATAFEIFKQTGLSQPSANTIVNRLRDDCGYDIRAFPTKRRSAHGPIPHVYKCIGKMRWDGSYRSFINDEVEAFFAEAAE